MTEQQPYEVVRDHGTFEVRRYPAHLVAEVTVEGPFDAAGSRAFRQLFAYITGANASRSTIEMTAPVLQSPADADGATLLRTTETGRGADGARAHRVSFVLPAALSSAPAPADPAVTLRAVPESLVAAARYSGRWSEARYLTHLEKLRADVEAAGLTPTGAERSARFDPPFMPAFLRHNEVLLDVRPAG